MSFEYHWLDCTKSFEDAHFLDGFGHADGRFHFAADWSAIGADYDAMSSLPDHLDVIDGPTDAHPYRLVAAPARRFLNTSFTETPSSRKKEGRPTALIHPDTCATLGLAEDDQVRLGNELGSVVVHVRPFDGLQAYTVVVEGIWPNDAFVEGRGINTIVSADAALPGGGAAFHDTAVWKRNSIHPFFGFAIPIGLIGHLYEFSFEDKTNRFTRNEESIVTIVHPSRYLDTIAYTVHRYFL